LLRARKSRRRRTASEISEEFGQTRTKIQNIFQRLKKATERTQKKRQAALTPLRMRMTWRW
jgi:predicted transcriptional regulator